jgi:Aldehyde dehydrogenase family
LGPVVSEAQYNKVQGLIEAGIKEGATLVTGGLGRPEHLNRGYYGCAGTKDGNQAAAIPGSANAVIAKGSRTIHQEAGLQGIPSRK